MQMRPIVDGLQADFADEVAFVYVNAADGATGQAAFERLQLLGHPAVVIFKPDGSESYRGFGIIKPETLREMLSKALSS
jgi:hypothetical protein